MSVAAAPGQTVRHYRILERLGAGGMGVVYKAEDTKLGRTVALKFLAPESIGDDAAKQRFVIEARAAAKLDHPNICTVHEVGEAEDGQLFIAMAYYEGETLDRRARRGALPLRDAVSIVRQIAEGLGAAHAAGIIHRDIKPANIVITSAGVAKILDFGLAKLTDVSMTRSRVSVGTAAYMAPEQVRGDRISPATDVWGLGVVLFELLTGHRPFRSDRNEGVLYSILNDPAPPLRDYRRDIPLQLETIVERMLFKEPAQRYASMRELLEELALPEAAPQSDAATDLFEKRFTPGSIVGGRYRIISLLGEGGMGEVYRADDLKLGQKVALKYIPRRFADDAEAYGRICAEVRIGRQLSHPNVCRIFDIVEAAGQRFIAMEFIDGEDLASLLRRIGRLPPDKALAVVRDIASGLAAAHDRGFVHRDLKPANIMIDGEGRARITDFGLAAVAAELSGTREVAGTPAYMAPEQFERGEVTARSDIFALGLIMFEMYRGHALLEGASLDEIRSQHDSLQRRLSGSRDVDPAVAKIIATCTERDPARRYASVHAVIAALPGGDALAAAVAAGETPSPGMVAAAARVGDLSAGRAWTLLAGAVISLGALLWLIPRVTIGGLVEGIRSQDALAARSGEVSKTFGHAPNRFVRYVTYYRNTPYLRWLRRTSPGDWSALRSAPPSGLRCIFRTSPVRFVPLNSGGNINPDDPPNAVPGMETLHFDHDGRLVRYERVAEANAPETRVSWADVFKQADLDLSRFRESEPQWIPGSGFDARAAWSGTHAAKPQLPLRVEAATLRGGVVDFRVIEPWESPVTPAYPLLNVDDAIATIGGLSALFLIVLVQRNIVRGRADLRGGIRVAVVIAIVHFAGTLSIAIPVVLPRLIWSLLANRLGDALLVGAMVFGAYVAIEPFVRRRWPHMLISWSRILQGRFRDPMVGRDLLVGLTFGSFVVVLRALLVLGVNVFSPGWELPLNRLAHSSFETSAGFIFAYTDPLVTTTLWSLGWLGTLVLLRLVLRRDGAALVAVWAVLSSTVALLPAGSLQLVTPITLACALLLLYRFGLVALMAFSFARQLLFNAPLTADFSEWYSVRSTTVVIVMVTLTAWAFYTSLGGKPVFGGMLAEEEQAGVS